MATNVLLLIKVKHCYFEYNEIGGYSISFYLKYEVSSLCNSCNNLLHHVLILFARESKDFFFGKIHFHSPAEILVQFVLKVDETFVALLLETKYQRKIYVVFSFKIFVET